MGRRPSVGKAITGNAKRRVTRAGNKASSALMVPLVLIAIVWAVIAKFCGD